MFNRIVAIKLVVIHALLQANKRVVFFDGDVVWLRDCLNELLLLLEHHDVVIQHDKQEVLCTGFVCIRPCQSTIASFDPSLIPPMCAGEQPVVNRMLKETSTKVYVLPSHKYANGLARRRSLHPNIVHYNFMLGHEKIGMMRLEKRWFLKGSPADEMRWNTARWRPGPHVLQGCVGPWIENAFYIFCEDVKYEPKHMTYLPISWTDLDDMSGIQTFLGQLDTSKRYFTVLQHASGIIGRGVHFPPCLDVTIFTAGSTVDREHARHMIPIPLLKDVLDSQAHRVKDIGISFAGNCGGVSDRKGIRSEMREKLANKCLFYQGPDWIDVMARSEFVLCPRGFGLTSFRLFEAIQIGCVPVYIYEDDPPLLPYANEIEWDKLAIIVHRNKIAHIPNLVYEADYDAMLQYGQRCRSMFTYEYVCDYIRVTVDSWMK
jgi:hypothetical protein